MKNKALEQPKVKIAGIPIELTTSGINISREVDTIPISSYSYPDFNVAINAKTTIKLDTYTDLPDSLIGEEVPITISRPVTYVTIECEYRNPDAQPRLPRKYDAYAYDFMDDFNPRGVGIHNKPVKKSFRDSIVHYRLSMDLHETPAEAPLGEV